MASGICIPFVISFLALVRCVYQRMSRGVQQTAYCGPDGAVWAINSALCRSWYKKLVIKTSPPRPS